MICPKCGGKTTAINTIITDRTNDYYLICQECGYQFLSKKNKVIK